MTKTAKSTQPALREGEALLGLPVKPAAAAILKAAVSKPVTALVSAEDIERCEKALTAKLGRAIINCQHDGELGHISQLVADLRALDMVAPGKVPVAPPAPPKEMTSEERRIALETKERQDAASDPVKMQAYNAKVARRESMEAGRAETSENE
jgi:hypothetical protein